MTGYEFATRAIELLRWPILIGVGLWLLRLPLTQLLPKLREFRYKDGNVRASFGQLLPKAREHAGKLSDKKSKGPAKIADSATAEDRTADLLKQCHEDATGAVLAAWAVVDEAGFQLLKHHNVKTDFDPNAPYRSLEDALVEEKLLQGEGLELFQDLRLLRNKVRHARAFAVTPHEAREYVHLAILLSDYLRGSSVA